jgi:hypothetical protein
MYIPDRWLLVKIGGTDPHYRIFGTWVGGYLGSDEWRLNSGVTRVEEDGNNYLFYGSSGSCYICRKNSYGSTSYGYGVIKSYEDDDRFSFMDEMPDDILSMDWIIS